MSHNLKLPIKKLFLAIALLLNAKKGLSSCQLGAQYRGKTSNGLVNDLYNQKGNETRP